MEEFYKNIVNEYENQDLPEFQEKDWDDMEERLDRDKKKQSHGYYWLLIIPFLGLLSWNVFLQRQLKNKSATSDISLGFDALDHRVDTVIKEKIVIIRDTIYEQRIKWLNSNPEIIEKIVFVDRPILKDNQEGSIDYWVSSREEGERNKNGIGLTHLKKNRLWQFATQDSDQDYLSGKPLNFLPQIDIKSISSVSKEEKVDSRVKKTPYLNSERVQSSWRRKMENSFSPVSLHAEVGAGLINAQNSELTPILGESFHAGVQLGFRPGYRLWLDIALHRMEFKSDVMDADLGVPVVIPPSDEFDFENAQVPRISMQYSVGLDYSFYKKSRLRPTIGVGWASVKYLQSEVIYDFINRDNGLEFIFEENSLEQEIHHNYIIAKIGFEYSITRKLDLVLAGLYRQGWDDPVRLNHLIGGGISLKTRLY